MARQGKWSRRQQQSRAGGAETNTVARPEATSPAAARTQRVRYRQLGTHTHIESAACSQRFLTARPWVAWCGLA